MSGEEFNAEVRRLIREQPGHPFLDALSKAVKSMVALVEVFNAHHDRHHTQELPSRSAMHAAYDHRRRARRARKRP